MTVVLDTSAVLALAIDGPQRLVAEAALASDPVWAASAMALTEALPAIDRLSDNRFVRLDLEDAVRRIWDHLHIVPVDQRCLDRAAALARTQPVRLTDAIHLAATERLPEPRRFVTFDPPSCQAELRAAPYGTRIMRNVSVARATDAMPATTPIRSPVATWPSRRA